MYYSLIDKQTFHLTSHQIEAASLCSVNCLSMQNRSVWVCTDTVAICSITQVFSLFTHTFQKREGWWTVDVWMSQVATTLKVKLAVILVEMHAQVDYYNGHRLYFLNYWVGCSLILIVAFSAF